MDDAGGHSLRKRDSFIMKYLVLSSGTGQGHNAAGKAVMEEFIKRDIPCEMKDAIAFAGPRAAETVSQAYIKTAVHAPDVFGYCYKAALAISSSHAKSVIYLANSAYADALGSYIREGGFTGVITPHLFPCDALTWLRRHHRLDVPAYGILTDYACIPFWEESEMDGWFISHPDVVKECVKRGMPEDKLLPTGIPVGQRFMYPLSRQQAREKLGFEESVRVITIMGGGMGYGNPTGILHILSAALAENDRIIVITGHNRKLADKLREEFTGEDRISILGFTNDASDYMTAADVVMTKPGGLSSTEVASLRMPLVHTLPIPGCETLNAAFFSSRGMSFTGKNDQELSLAALRLLNDADARERMRTAQEENINPFAARDIVDFVTKGG